MSTQRSSVRDWIKSHPFIICLALVILLSIFLRFYNLGTESVWLDEVESIRESGLSIQGIANSANQPPLYFLLLRGWISLFGTSEIAIRSLSAIFGVSTVIVIYITGNALINKRVGLIGAFLSSFSYFLIFHSQDARAYSLLVLLSTLSYWFFIQIFKTDKKRFYAAYIICSILLIFTHFYSLFIIASQILFFLIFIKKYTVQRLKYAITVGILIAAMIPMLLLLKNNILSIANNGFWISEPENLGILNTLIGFSGIGATKYVVFAIFLICAVWGLITINKSKEKLSKTKLKEIKKKSSGYRKLESLEVMTLLLLWLFIPILVPFIESRLMTPIYQAKYVIGTFPALCLLVSNGLDNIKWEWVFYPVLALIVIFSSFGLSDYYKYDVNEQWRETARFIESNSQSDDIIVFCESYYQRPFNYYYKGSNKEEGFNSVEEAQGFINSAEGIALKNQGRLWLILAYNKSQIYTLFENTYGKDAVKSVHQYTGITIILFNSSGS